MKDFMIEGYATLTDKVSPTLDRIEKSLSQVAEEMREGSGTATAYRETLEAMVPADELGSESKIVQKAIDDMIDGGDIKDATAWKEAIRSANRSVRSMHRETSISDAAIESLGDEFTESAIQAVEFREAVENSIDTKNVAQAELLGEAIDDIVDAGDIGDLEALRNALISNSVASGVTAEGMDHLHRQIDKVGDEGLQAAGQLQALNASVMATDGGLRRASRSADDMDDAFEALGFKSARLSADLGFLNISLQNIAQTLPELGVVLGSVTKTLGGLVVGLVGVGGAIGALTAGGLLGWGQAIDEQFQSVEGTMEGVTVLMRAVGRAIQDAMQPLVSGQLADGTSVMQAFLNILGGVVDMVRVLSVGFRDILARPEIQTFFQRMGDALFGINAQAGGLAESLDTLGDATARVLPLLTDILIFAGSKMIDIMDDWSRATVQMGDELVEFTGALFDLMSKLANFGIILGEVVLPHLATLLEAGAKAVEWINNLDESTIKTALSMLLLAFAISEVKALLITLRGLAFVQTLTRMSLAFGMIAVAILEMTNTLDDAKNVLSGFLSLIPGLSNDAADSVGQSTLAVGAFFTALFAGLKRLGPMIKKASDLLRDFRMLWMSLGSTKWVQVLRNISPTLVRIGEIAVAVGSRLRNAFTALRVALAGLTGGGIFGTLKAAFLALAGAVGGVAAAIVVIIAAIVGLIFVIGYLTGDLQKAIEKFPMLQGAIEATLNPIRTLKSAWGDFMGFITASITDFDALEKKFTGLGKKWQWFGDMMLGIGAIVRAVAMVFIYTWEILVWAAEEGMKVWNGIMEEISPVVDKVSDVVAELGILHGIFEVLFTLVKALAYIFIGLLVAVLSPLILILVILGNIAKEWDNITSGVKSFVDTVVKQVDRAIKKFNELKDAVPDAIGGAVDMVTTNNGQVANRVPRRGQSVAQGAPQRTNQARPAQQSNQTVVNNNNITVEAGNGMSKQEARETARDVDRETERRKRNRRGY